jgi:3-oxoacyl-[acyl-carrier protein] reductase
MKRKWTLVTGGSRGIGAAIVRQLVESGYAVAFTYKNSLDKARRLVEELEAAGHQLQALEIDGRHHRDVLTAVTELADRWGPPHALINNQGITRDGSALNMEYSDWLEVIDCNLNSAFYFIKACLPHMLEQGGCIVQVSSVSGLKGTPGQINYSASKAGLLGLTRSLAVELARFHIRVNAICPGFIETDMLEPLQAQKSALLRHIPQRALGQANDVAHTIRYLLSDEARYITGQTITIDGGLTA